MPENFLDVRFKDAECARVENQDVAEAFFSEESAEWEAAKKLCSVCPVRQLCLEGALAEGQVFGVWGGLDETELRTALGVNSDGGKTSRIRPTDCPNCSGGPEGLALSTRTATGRWETVRVITCGVCAFSWEASGAYAVLKAWRIKQGLPVEDVPTVRGTLKPKAGPVEAPRVLKIGADVREPGYYTARAFACVATGCAEPRAKGAEMCDEHVSQKVHRKCSVPECNEAVRSVGMCLPHYQKTRYVPKGPPRQPKTDHCTSQDCTRAAYARNLCAMHYQRANRLEREARS